MLLVLLFFSLLSLHFFVLFSHLPCYITWLPHSLLIYFAKYHCKTINQRRHDSYNIGFIDST